MEDQRGDLLAAEGLSRLPARVGLAIVLALASIAGAQLWRACRGQTGLAMWDESAHGLAGLQVADALRHLDPPGLFLAINRQALWPFVHSLMLAPAYLIAGNGLASAEATSVLLFVATMVLLFVAGTLVHPTRGAWVGLAAAALALLSPSYRVFGSLVMLEMPGAFLLVLAFVLHARAAARASGPGALGAAGWAATALFLCKYNYGVLWLAAVCLWEWQGIDAEARRRTRSALRALAPPRAWLRPMPLLFAAGALAVLLILATGGGAFTVLGQRISVRSPGNLAYALWLAFGLWMILPRRGRESRAAWAWARLPKRARILGGTILLPLAVWFTIPWPNHLREFFHFVANRDSGMPVWTAEGLLFYPRAFAADFSPGPVVASVALALAWWPPPPGRDHRPARLAWLAFAIAFAAIVLHRYRDSRFFFTVCPMLWLCAARNAVATADRLLGRVRPRALREGLWLAAAALTIAVAWPRPARDAAWIARRSAFRGPGDFVVALDAVLDEVGSAATPSRGPRSALLGYSNLLSPGLLAWHARLTRPEIPPGRLPQRVPFLGAGADEAALKARGQWLDARAEVVIAALADSVPESADYADETWADRRMVARMASGAESGWTLRQERTAGRFQISRFERDR